jgi:hypothetical protein
MGQCKTYNVGAGQHSCKAAVGMAMQGCSHLQLSSSGELVAGLKPKRLEAQVTVLECQGE